MGTVYKARDTKLDRVVALKVLSRSLTSDPRFVERFSREVKLTAALNHRNIVTAFGAGEAEGLPYLAMEFVDGESLHKRLRRKKMLPEKEALTIIKGVAAGLEHAHSHGFIHRDVKPDNALISSDGTVRVADLGLAKSVDDDQRLTKTGTAIGTPHYISPEQARGEKNVDHRSDIYSLGATLYTLLTGRRPFDGKNNAEIMLKHLNEELENPQDLVPEISDATVAIVSKMMAKKPGHRYDSCRQLIADVDRVLGAKVTEEIGSPRGESSIRPPRRRRRRMAARAKASSSSGCLLFLAVGGTTLLSGCWLVGRWILL
jgi:serine/threonine-protein kinase